jgi:hypothetical protein
MSKYTCEGSLGFARGPGHSYSMITSTSLGGRRRRPSEAEAMLSAELMVPERSRWRVVTTNYKLLNTGKATLFVGYRGTVFSDQ